MRKVELLVPASSLEVLKTAVIFGADAVYIGGEAFGLRAKAKNFSMEEMAEGIRFDVERNGIPVTTGDCFIGNAAKNRIGFDFYIYIVRNININTTKHSCSIDHAVAVDHSSGFCDTPDLLCCR